MNRHHHNSTKNSCEACLLLLCVLLFASGCQTRKNLVQLPARHSIRSEQLMILSNNKLKKDHPYLKQLSQIREQIADDFNLEFNKDREVHVYIFDNEEVYNNYMNKTYPGLPSRRAYFVGTPQELMVFTFWGERVLEDLRHEFTHGLLHSTLHNVPLWLDEGLAEYYEHDNSKSLHTSAAQIKQAISNGWTPDMGRLEQLENVHEMKLIDYQEAWAWVYFMLHQNQETKELLVDYVHRLKKTGNPSKLSSQMAKLIPESNKSLADYIIKNVTEDQIQLIRGNNPHHHDSH